MIIFVVTAYKTFWCVLPLWLMWWWALAESLNGWWKQGGIPHNQCLLHGWFASYFVNMRSGINSSSLYFRRQNLCQNLEALGTIFQEISWITIREHSCSLFMTRGEWGIDPDGRSKTNSHPPSQNVNWILNPSPPPKCRPDFNTPPYKVWPKVYMYIWLTKCFVSTRPL